MSRTQWHRRAGLLVIGWFAAAVLVSLIHRQLPAASWLLVHLLLLGAVTNAIVIWSGHFATALLRLPDTGFGAELGRLVALNAAALVVVAGMVAGIWPAVAAGAAAVAAAVLWHVMDLLARMRRALPSRFGLTVRYYVAAGLLLVPAVALGVWLARGAGGLAAQVLLGHAAVALMGWVGLTALGTLITFWPTILRTQIVPGSELAGRRALPPLVAGVVVTGSSIGAGVRAAAVAGVALYLIGVAALAVPFLRELRNRRPSSFAPRSVLAAVAWMTIALIGFGLVLAVPADWEQTVAMAGWLSGPAIVGFVVQVLLGSLSYLLPAMAGGGPAAVRWRNSTVDRGATTRLVAGNGTLLVCILPVPSTVRVVASVVALVAFAAALPLLARALLAQPEPAAKSVEPAPAAARSGGIVAGLAAVVLAVALGTAANPAALGVYAADVASAAAGVAATGQTTTVEVTAAGMRFTPAVIDVPVGNRLVLKVTNAGDDTHDLTVETGDATPLLKPREAATLDLGVIGRDLDAWCSVAGHRQMGMTMRIVATGTTPPAAGAGQDHDTHADSSAPGQPARPPAQADQLPDLMADPGPGFQARDPQLPPVRPGREHRVRLVVTETEQEVAPGVRQKRWTFGGTAPGPVLHGRAGDTFVVTLVNDGTIGHSVDFHAGALAPDRPMRTIQPGEELTYRFSAERAGIWMYHCSTMPMSMHIANGMFGAVVIDPPGLPPVDREFLMVQSEGYLGAQGSTADAAKIAAGQHDLVSFNGYPMQYDHEPLRARKGDRVRFWVLAAGPNVGSSFHVVGAQFDTVWFEGDYLLRRGHGGSQALGLTPAQGGFVELTMPEPGSYPFVTHVMSDAERGAHGMITVR